MLSWSFCQALFKLLIRSTLFSGLAGMLLHCESLTILPLRFIMSYYVPSVMKEGPFVFCDGDLKTAFCLRKCLFAFW